MALGLNTTQLAPRSATGRRIYNLHNSIGTEPDNTQSLAYHVYGGQISAKNWGLSHVERKQLLRTRNVARTKSTRNRVRASKTHD